MFEINGLLHLPTGIKKSTCSFDLYDGKCIKREEWSRLKFAIEHVQTVQTVTVTDAEYNLVRNSFNNLPITISKSGKCIWVGEMAMFILKNMLNVIDHKLGSSTVEE